MRIVIAIRLFLLLFCTSIRAESIAYFIPPKEWVFASPESSSNVHIAFVEKDKKGFCPSINLASEEAKISLTEYLAIAKKLHQADRDTVWRDLGSFSCKSGEGRLTAIDVSTEWGPVRLLQFLFLFQERAYILTAAALKKEIANYNALFEAAFRTLKISENLVGEIEDTSQKSALENAIAQLKNTAQTLKLDEKEFEKNHWKPFEKMVCEKLTPLGPYWQVLLLSSVRQSLSPIN